MTTHVGDPVRVPPHVHPGTPSESPGDTEGGAPVVVGPEGPPGPQGPQGPPGPSGAAAEQEQTFASPSTHWVVTHSFPKHPDVHLFDLYDEPIGGEIRWPDATTVTVDFYYPMAGKVRLD